VDPDWTPLRPVPSKPDPVKERYPALWQFFGCYFHQDWVIEAADDSGLVQLFLDSEPGDEADRVRAELDLLLAGPRTEAETGEILRHLGCDYDPAQTGLSDSDWLQRVRTLLDRG
jgi:hypothetical protein